MFARFITCFSGLIRIIILIQYFLGTSCAQPITTALCDHSACGNIRNISNPLRLRGDPPHCGDSRCELVCENDTTLMYFGSQKLLVQSIDYNNYTIRVSDPSLTNDTCSFPRFQYNFYSPYISLLPAFTTRDVTILSCEYPVNYSFYTKVPERCLARNKYTSRYVYMKYGGLNASDVGHMCTIDLVVNTAMQLKDDNNISHLEIHRALLYGFELSWFRALCGRNCETWQCGWDGNRATCNNPTYPFRECNLGLCINIEEGPGGVTGNTVN